MDAAALPLDHKGHRAGRARAAGERHGSTFPWILGELLSTEGLSNYVSAPAFAAAFTWSRSNRRTSHRSRSHGPTVSGAPRLRDYNSACSAVGAKKYRPALSRAVPSRHARKTKLGGVQALASARMGKAKPWVRVSSQPLVFLSFIFVLVPSCDESVCVRYP